MESKASRSFDGDQVPGVTKFLFELTAMSTPRSIRTAKFYQHVKSSDIQTALRSGFDGPLYPDVPVQPFVEIVPALDEAYSKKFTNAAFQLCEEPLLKYMQVLILEKKNFKPNSFKNIWKAQSVVEFRKVFLDCLECHYHAWSSRKALHRDITEYNLMIYQPGVTDKDTSGATSEGETSTIPPSRGILKDFDMSTELDVDGNAQLTAGPHHRITGMLPFMARDLLIRLDVSTIEEKIMQGIEPSDAAEAIMDEEIIEAKTAAELKLPEYHLYRHDLESFLYILIWAAAHYELDTGV